MKMEVSLGVWLLGIFCITIRVKGDCESELGMINKQISDDSITASSHYQNNFPHLARVDSNSGAWCSDPTDVAPYIQIDLKEEKIITGVDTQGSFRPMRWAEKFKIKYLLQNNWTTYSDSEGSDKVFEGSVGVYLIKINVLQPPLRTQKIRIYPYQSQGDPLLNNVACLRLELKGCALPDCGDPGTPSNGRKLGVTYSLNSKVNFNCDLGYELWGSEERKCQQNGTWTGQQPVCKASCRRPEPPRNGRMRGDNFNHNEKVVFYCDENYQLVGQSQITCKDGSWSDLFPKCIVVNCGPLQRPDHGKIIEIVGTTFGNRIVFECIEKGYEIRGSKVRTCQSDGSWSGLPTTCELVKCDDPGTPVNGMRIVSKGLVYGGSLRFKCNRDYTLMKGMSEIIYCQANKRWTASVPHCLAPCRDPGVPRQGNRIGDDVRHNSKVTFSCPNGYLMEGVGEISCSNGTWSNRVPTCKAPCVKIFRPANGYMRGDFGHGNQVSFLCYHGYQMIGAASSTCNDGTWSNSAPICKGVCGRPRVSSRGPLILHGNSFLDGDEVQFSCVANYDLFGSQRSRCVGRRWNTAVPECKARCIFGGDPDNGFAVRNAFFDRMVRHGLQIVYRCNEQYTLIGSATQRCNNGRWTNSRPSCKAPCRDPGVPRQANRIGNDFRHSSNVIFTCPDDYLMEGVRKISCSNGVWSNRVPTCKAPCVKFSRPANGDMRGDFRHGNQVRFRCYGGYQRIGAASSTCNDGTWSNSAPICKGTCGRPIVSSRGPLNLHGNSFFDGDEVQFSCIANYDLFGSQKSRCVGRKWNTRIPECKARCVFGGDPDNGFAVRDAFFNRVVTHGVQITYRCNENYTLIGSATQECNNGHWTNSRPSCKASCQWPGHVDNGTKVGHSYKHGDTVQYVCNEGYVLDGKQNLTCADGVWSSHRPACKVSCRRPEPPRNGGMRGDNFYHNEKVVFYCDENYQLFGESEIICKDGSWNDLFPICVATCPNPGEPAHGRRLSNDFQDGRTVAFECDDGFDLFGNKGILCIGSFWNASVPECKAACNHPGDIAHGLLTSQHFSHGQLVRYKCDLGYSLEGNHKLTCNNGDWNSHPPQCKACQNRLGTEDPSIRNAGSANYLSSPDFARLNGRLAWCTTKQTYLQVNLDKRHQLTAIATQGGEDNTGIIRWVRKYKLGFFAGPRKEIFYQESGTQQVIDGNQNATTTITYFFKEPFITQVVRIYPNFHSTPVCLRMELYGCDPKPDCIHVGSVVWGLWEREGDSLSYYLVYITQLNATHVDFVLDFSHSDGRLLTRTYNRSEPVLVVDKTPRMTDISVGSRVIGVHRRRNKEWYKNGIVIRTFRSLYAYVRFNSGTERWVPLEELRLEKRPRFCTPDA